MNLTRSEKLMLFHELIQQCESKARRWHRRADHALADVAEFNLENADNVTLLAEGFRRRADKYAVQAEKLRAVFNEVKDQQQSVASRPVLSLPRRSRS